jgi:Leishmanolysin
MTRNSCWLLSLLLLCCGQERAVVVAQGQLIATLELMDSNTKLPVATLRNGTVIIKSDSLPAYNILATLNELHPDAASVKSVRFGFDTNVAYNTENVAPYTFCPPQAKSTTTASTLRTVVSPLHLLKWFKRRRQSPPTAVDPSLQMRACDVLGYGAHTVTITTYTKANAAAGSAIRLGTVTIAFSIVQTAPPSVAPVNKDIDTKIGPPFAPAGEFAIALDLVGIPPSDVAYFANAAARWQTVITGDLSNEPTRNLPPRTDGCTYPSTIDDVFICAQYQAVDGPGAVLGFAGPEYVRSTNSLPMSGFIGFDLADVPTLTSKGGFGITILHEMGHVLGIGTLWASSKIANPSPSCDYIGAKANAEYKAISGCNAVPTERGGNPGTTCLHWDEKCLRNELMTGYFTAGGTGPMSRITIGSLEDLGYSVDYSRADPFTAADLGPGCTCSTRQRHLRNSKQPTTVLDMSHGTTIPLGFLNSRDTEQAPPRRRLSDEAYAEAVQAGLDYLSDQEHTPAQAKQIPSGVTYVGDKVISVLVEDGGAVFGVVVRTQP